MRATRWAIAALIGSAMTAIACGRPNLEFSEEAGAVSTLPRLRERDIFIEIVDGVLVIGGEVWTPLEKEHLGNLVRSVAGMNDVANELDIRPPR